MEKKINRMCNVSLIMSIIFIVIGLFLFIKPDTTISIISFVIGGALLLSGIFSTYRYFSSDEIINAFNFDLIYGVLLFIAGVFMIFNPTALATLFPIILGIWIIINSVTKFQYARVLKKAKNEDWVYTTFISILTLIWGIVLLYNPLKSILAITQIIGVFIIVYAVLDIFDNMLIKKNIKNILDMFK